MIVNHIFFLLSSALLVPSIEAFLDPQSKSPVIRSFSQPLYSSPNTNNEDLGEKFGGFTTKQRLREEIESPFRKVRLAFFSFSGVSAFVALYFSALVSSIRCV